MTSAAPPPLPPLARRLTTLAGALTVDVRTFPDGRAVLRPRGELVHGCARTLAKALAGLPAETTRVDLDLALVTFMDTAGLELLDVLDGYGRARLVPVTATGWTGQPLRILELAGLDTADPLKPAVPGPPVPATRAASAVAVERAERLRQLQQEVAQLRQAIASRPVIDQARGILMAAHACTPQQAWDILREASQRSNTKLRTVAAWVVEGARPDAPAPPPALRHALRAAIARTTAPAPAPDGGSGSDNGSGRDNGSRRG
ncbi:ANTAR domain-containing response regulator [Streptomyces sennicomposti]|uniref:ANTAR domain-containing response regulator n=1 Tax=Streptomyces sennicomposti TaxID=2873384 RepID=UPI001CA7145D|nr:ANTAR domain-containing protein [Streptomyces sennicomposti]MBY8869465.1 ANTAR domain-containing protein [Streptomyces sennicomposti]